MRFFVIPNAVRDLYVVDVSEISPFGRNDNCGLLSFIDSLYGRHGRCDDSAEIAGGDTGAPGHGARGNKAREVFHRFGSSVFNNDQEDRTAVARGTSMAGVGRFVGLAALTPMVLIRQASEITD
jgi:hypothetical protein